MKDREVNGQPVIVSGENTSPPNEKQAKGPWKERMLTEGTRDSIIMELSNAVWSKEDNSC